MLTSDNPELAAVESLAWAQRKIEGCLSRPMPHLADPTVGERRTKLDRAIELLREADTLLDEGGFGLRGRHYTANAMTAAMEAAYLLRDELK